MNNMRRKILKFKWGVSRGRDTYGYNLCTLYVDGTKVARCNGGGYDMEGTVLGDYIASAYPERLLKLTEEFYGLKFHDPNFDPGKVVPATRYILAEGEEHEGKTVAQMEEEGLTIGLERYQAFHSDSSKIPTERHIIPLLDGACGKSSMEKVANAIGLTLEYIDGGRNSDTIYILRDTREEE